MGVMVANHKHPEFRRRALGESDHHHHHPNAEAQHLRRHTMNLYQCTAALPHHGHIQFVWSPSSSEHNPPYAGETPKVSTDAHIANGFSQAATAGHPQDAAITLPHSNLRGPDFAPPDSAVFPRFLSCNGFPR